MENTNLISDSLNIDMEKQLKKQKVLKIVKNVICYTVLTLFGLFALLPFYWMILSSLKTEDMYREAVPTFFVKISELQWNNYKEVIVGAGTTKGLFGEMLVNTLVVGIVSTLLGVIVTIITAYAFAKMEFKGKNLLFSLLLATMMVPGELFTITNYVTIVNFKWDYSYTVMVLPFLVSVFYIFLLRNAFKQIPDSLYKAAKVDGCSDVKYLIKVMIPLTAPTLTSIFLLKFIGTWNSYIWPRLANSGDQHWQLLSNWVSNGFASSVDPSTTLDTLKMAAATMVSLPLMILFICFRKYIMRGVSKSGIKG